MTHLVVANFSNGVQVRIIHSQLTGQSQLLYEVEYYNYNYRMRLLSVGLRNNTKQIREIIN